MASPSLNGIESCASANHPPNVLPLVKAGSTSVTLSPAPYSVTALGMPVIPSCCIVAYTTVSVTFASHFAYSVVASAVGTNLPSVSVTAVVQAESVNQPRNTLFASVSTGSVMPIFLLTEPPVAFAAS